MKFLFAVLIVTWATGFHGVTSNCFHASCVVPSHNLSGRWQVKYSLSGLGEKTLVSEFKPSGVASFELTDTGLDKGSVIQLAPAVWSENSNERVSFSGEVELPLGTCCREKGTLIFKGKFEANGSIVGKAIFIGATIDEENLNGFRSTAGTFVAQPNPKQ